MCPSVMHGQLHLKATWKETMKLWAVLTLERGPGLGSMVGRVKGFYAASFSCTKNMLGDIICKIENKQNL